MQLIGRFGHSLKARQRWVLFALLVFLHLTLMAGASSTVGLMLWIVDVGLFLLWQPFIQAERRLGAKSVLLIAILLAAVVWTFGTWLLIIWVIVLASLLGGRVMMLGHRPTRIFYLLAFAYLLVALLVWLVPAIVPEPLLVGPSLERPFRWAAPLLFLAMMCLPRPREMPPPGSGMVDFFYSLFIFLLVSVLVLGSLAFMLLQQSLYIEAVFKTLVSIAAVLLLIGWAWNPRPGFSGIGVFLSRYLLTIGLPFEAWLQRLLECAEQEEDPERFISRALGRLLELPWVSGGSWSPAPGAAAGHGVFGEESAFRELFHGQPLEMVLFTRHKLSPALIWHFHLLLQLTNEYYGAKQRERELREMSYLRAVHETGARLTHDVKNLLQSLNNLCFMAQSPGKEGGKEFTRVLQRQLPLITQRLQQTLEKLQVPQGQDAGAPETLPQAAETWWTALQQRYPQPMIEFAPVTLDAGIVLPAALFDSVADNVLNNALLKQQTENGVRVRVVFSPDAARLSFCDNGRAVREDIAERLLHAPVQSDNGLGIGLFHAARQAEAYGHELRLASNEDGRVCFELIRREGAADGDPA